LTPSVRQLLQQAIAAHNKKNFQEAEKLYRAVLRTYPKNPDANHNLGLLALAVNQPVLALPLLKTALDANRNVERYWIGYINGLSKIKQFEKAKKFIRQGKKQGIILERVHEAYNSLGIALKADGKLKEAEEIFRKAISLAPSSHLLHVNLGNTLQELNRIDDAVENFRKAILLKPDFAETYFNLANTLQLAEQYVEAVVVYKQAIDLNPKHVVAFNNLGLALSKLGSLKEAETQYKNALKLMPNYYEAHLNIGNLHYGLQQFEKAEEDYQKAIAIQPNYADAYLNLCELYEKTNKLTDVLSVVKKARDKVSRKKDEFLLFEAFVLFRQDRFQFVEEIISKINPDKLSENRKTIFFKLKADWLHHQENFDEAFEAYEHMNNNVKNSAEYQMCSANQYYDAQREKICEIESLQETLKFRNIIQAKWFQPSFLIGFPRSGTTLLDTILRSHSGIDVVEEQPLVSKMLEKLGATISMSDIEAIDLKSAKVLSDIYFRELEKSINIQENILVIDKLPLNILSIPIITKVFPEAKFILALRHPLDCVLSCWMQNFKLNAAMANMVDLDRIVDFYCTTMEILKLCEQRYSINIHPIRYEDLVSDFIGTISILMNFLELSWEDQLEGYQRTALSRAKINTPSYTQVVKPIYETAAYRWKKYEDHLQPHKPKLAHWINEFGYNG
jgi:tetratricopeptide (TPR) repeat protein